MLAMVSADDQRRHPAGLRIAEVQRRPLGTRDWRQPQPPPPPLAHDPDGNEHEAEQEQRRHDEEEHHAQVRVGVDAEQVGEEHEQEQAGRDGRDARAHDRDRVRGRRPAETCQHREPPPRPRSREHARKRSTTPASRPTRTAVVPTHARHDRARRGRAAQHRAGAARAARSASNSPAARRPVRAAASRPVKITRSIGNFSGRMCPLKKWIVKMKPTASSASSPWISIAMLKTQPGSSQREERRKPEQQPRPADDQHPPEDRPVVELLPVGEVAELRARPEADEPAEVLVHLDHVTRLRHHRVRSPERPVVLPDVDPLDDAR